MTPYEVVPVPGGYGLTFGGRIIQQVIKGRWNAEEVARALNEIEENAVEQIAEAGHGGSKMQPSGGSTALKRDNPKADAQGPPRQKVSRAPQVSGSRPFPKGHEPKADPPRANRLGQAVGAGMR